MNVGTRAPLVIRYVARLNVTVGYLTASVGNTAVLAYGTDAAAGRGRVFGGSSATAVAIDRSPWRPRADAGGPRGADERRGDDRGGAHDPAFLSNKKKAPAA